MRAIITAGGTGGHIYPALAIHDKIKKEDPSSQFLYIGTTDRMEKTIIPERNIDFIGIKIRGIKRSLTLKNITAIIYFIKAIRKSKKIIKEFKPDIVIGVGGYVTAPVIYAANKLKIKTVIHEQNSMFGLSNKFLLRYSDIIFTSLPNTVNYSNKYKSKIIYSGNPCSESAVTKDKQDKTSLGFSEDKKLILIVMGSLGSLVINNIMKEILPKFKNKEYEILFVTGKNYYDDFKSTNIKNVKIFSYIEDMVRIMKSSDLIVSRAGATTISEIIAISIPSILVPSPHVTNNHQYINALDLVNKDASILLEEKDLTKLVQKIDEIIYDEIKLKDIKDNLNQFKVKNSTTTIYNNIKKLIGD